MCWLHGFLDNAKQVLTQLAQVHFAAQRCAERLHGPGRIILATIEAAVNHALNPMTQGLEQGSDHQRRGDDHQGDAPHGHALERLRGTAREGLARNDAAARRGRHGVARRRTKGPGRRQTQTLSAKGAIHSRGMIRDGVMHDP